MRLLTACLLTSLVLVSCNIINPDEQEPAYVYVKDISFTAGINQGTSDQKFTDVWVYADNTTQLITSVPANVPILKEGSTDIKVFAGIKNNGLSDSRIIYPFVKPYEYTASLKPLVTDTIRPVFEYYPTVDIDQKDFESGGTYFVGMSGDAGAATTVTDPNYVFEGTRSGLLKLNTGSYLLYKKISNPLYLTSGENYFLELNYSCNDIFAVGLISTESSIPTKNLILLINPTTADTEVPTWKKIYIDLGAVPQQHPNADNFEIYFEISSSTGATPISLYLDNIKFLKFQ
jgi:hypothetical protein